MLLLGLEASTSSAKALLFDTVEGLIKEVQNKYSDETADMKSMDSDGVFEALMVVAETCLEGFSDKVQGIAMATIWNSLQFYDDQGKALRRTRTWADLSGDLAILQACESDFLYTGCPQSFKFARWQLMCKDEQKIIHEASNVGFLSDDLYRRMTGKWCVSRMSAAGSGLLNLETGDWHEPALKSIGLASEKLPPLVGYKVKEKISQEVALRLGLSNQVEVGFPNGDGGLNQVCESGLDQGIMTMSVGTSAAVRVMTDQLPAKEDEGIWCHYLSKGHYITGATIAGGGNCLDWYMARLNKDHKTHEALVASISEDSREEGPIFLPFIFGEQSPGWQRERGWGFTGDWKTQGYYSVLEGILFNLYQGYDLVCKRYGQPKEIRLSGGILHSPYWVQLAADIFNQPMVLSKVTHTSLLGAFRVFDDQIKVLASEDVVYPRDNRDLIQSRYRKYLEAYKGQPLIQP